MYLAEPEFNKKSECACAATPRLRVQLQRTKQFDASRSGRNTRASAACDAVRPKAVTDKSEDRDDKLLQLLKGGTSEMR